MPEKQRDQLWPSGQVLVSKDESVAGRVVEHVKGLEAEVNVLKHLDHPNIVRYLVCAML